MLKIKDNVDLKELEKFGFTKLYRLSGSIYRMVKHFNGYNYNYYNEEENTKNDILVIYKKDRIIKYLVDRTEYELLQIANDIVFNLQQAGLVEKVE